jgi:hypothetical protein
MVHIGNGKTAGGKPMLPIDLSWKYFLAELARIN